MICQGEQRQKNELAHRVGFGRRRHGQFQNGSAPADPHHPRNHEWKRRGESD